MKKIGVIVLLVIFILILVSFFFEIRRITSQNMEPALKHGQIVVVKKYFLGPVKPNRGEIVFYHLKNSDFPHVGRVIGFPSESIRIENDHLYLDNNIKQYRVEEEYLSPETKTTAYQEREWFKIGEFEYFIAGDNREDTPINIPANFIHRNNIKGKLFIKF